MIISHGLLVCLVLLSSHAGLGQDKSSSNSSRSKSKTKNKNLPTSRSCQNLPSSSNIPCGYVDGKQCARQCNGARMSCFFSFPMETFYSMSKACYNCPNVLEDCYRPDCIVGGGVKRTVMVVDRQMPGPIINVCEGDEVMVYVQNHLIDAEATTIHYHGQHMVRDKYMDGVPWVTQCPIHWNNNFTYEFWVDNPGTFWWHSHIEMQRGDGVYGAMIVRQIPARNIHINRYDFDLPEHVVMIGDWNNQLRLEVFEGYALAGNWLEPTGILVNGYGYQSSSNITNTPPAVFTVRQGFRYRFRLINVNFFDCPLEFSIDGHRMTIIATDSKDLQPFDVDSFVTSSGERFDFIINANQPINAYFIRVKGYLVCERLNTFTVATLRYEGSRNPQPTGIYPTYATAAPTGGVLYNPVSITNATGYSNVIGIHQAKSVERLGSGIATNDLYRYYISVDMSGLDNPAFHRYPYYGFNDVDPNFRARTPQFNRISHKYLDIPMLPGRFVINQDVYCNAYTVRNQDCANTLCACPHVYAVPKNAIVEFVFVELFDQDDAPALHPIHLHGYSFYVLGWGEIGRNLTLQRVIDMDQRGQLFRNFNNPPLKDTVTVPKGGYTIVRFRASNVGYWLMHCHIDVHATEGMDLVLKVGNDNEMPEEPEDFPECGNWPEYGS